MTNEELEKKMEFIVERQAQFTVDIQKLQESQAITENIVNRLATASLERITNLEEKMAALVDAQIKTESTVAETNERLNAFIVVVERYISGSHNGESKDQNENQE